MFTTELSAANKLQLLIPKGFAHGYSVISPVAEVFYKCDTFWNKESEGGISLKDPTLNIDWKIPEAEMIISEKDTLYPGIEECRNNFVFNP